MHYFARWPNYNVVSEAPGGKLMGYGTCWTWKHIMSHMASAVMGKAEGKGDQWHGHVTAVTVAPEYRRLGVAKILMDYLEILSDLV